MSHTADVPLEAPTMIRLASAAVMTQLENDEFMETVVLPTPLSEELFGRFRDKWNYYNQHGAQHVERLGPPDGQERVDQGNLDMIRQVFRVWSDSTRLPLQKLDLTGATIDDQIFVDLLHAHAPNITELDLTNVTGVTDLANAYLYARSTNFPTLTSIRMTSMELVTGHQPRRKNGIATTEFRSLFMLGEEALAEARGPIERDGIRSPLSPSSMDIQEEEDMLIHEQPVNPPLITARAPNVRRLFLPRTPNKRSTIDEEEQNTHVILSKILSPLQKLEVLDLSYWSKTDDMRCLMPLSNTLTCLVLYEVPDLYHAIPSICQMTELQVLDISQSNKDTGTYPNPVTTLNKIIVSLKKLTHLDISSTNLATQPSSHDNPARYRESVRTDICGLQSLVKPLKYLGLFNCESASHVREIPAEVVSGDANEDQVITSLKMYKDRAGLLQNVLNESYQLYRFGNSNPLTRHTEALHLVLEAMHRHLADSTLQIAGSASLFYIIRKVDMNRDTKRRVVSALLSGMEVHMEEQVMVRNCCLSLCQFEIPQDILFDYSRLAVLLVSVLQHHNADNLTQRIVVFLLNSMACHVEGDQKVQVGSYGAIEMILDQISRKHTANICDDVMEVGWSFLWNITDETPVNCELFLNANGLDLFQKCYEAFKTERELVRNMMGLIGNIAEVDALRSQLMKDDYVNIFCALLTSQEESIEISYNSAGVLAHMVSDGEEVWEKLTVCRQEVMRKIVEATSTWKLATRRFINYRSFRPILRLLPLYHAYASQHWAVWALANLTTTDGEKWVLRIFFHSKKFFINIFSRYCAYVRDEGGVPLLQELVSNPITTQDIRHLANTVLDNIRAVEMKRINPNWRPDAHPTTTSPVFRPSYVSDVEEEEEGEAMEEEQQEDYINVDFDDVAVPMEY
ncbi:Protein CBR-ZER-1 [Caenorhabditis briggsae]|uniref:Protein CBR-ZER-1 n=1 Tax=Caenorhabditis briggsae TaxID=6238 RepID=A8XLR7_CAEBR|nr:Protein CBR-ZER-1 [Caenorhabditis briggsae]CAP33571.2 Protein CBR-ZER-1 [Caenorhabditis briggsae]